MFRTLLVHGAVAVTVAAPIGVAAVDDTEPDDSAPATSVADSAAPTSGSPGSAPEGGSGPPPGDPDFQVDMILGLVPEDEMNDYWREQEEERQLRIQECMNEAGFEYNPENVDDMMMTDPLADLPPMEFAEQWGFGIYTTMDPETSPYNVDVGDDFVWPNQEIVDALSPSEQNAWYEVNNRCWNETSMEDDPYRNPMVQQAIEDFFADVENDPRMREAMETWQDCMEEQGHPFASQEDMWDELQGDDFELMNQFFESEAWEPDSPDHAEWQRMVELEIEIAVADASCSPALQEVRQEVIADLRPQFVEVWQTIDWSLPPVTFPGEGEIFIEGEDGEMIIPGSEVPTDTGEVTDDTQSALDLGAPTETSEPEPDATVPETTEP